MKNYANFYLIILCGTSFLAGMFYSQEFGFFSFKFYICVFFTFFIMWVFYLYAKQVTQKYEEELSSKSEKENVK